MKRLLPVIALAMPLVAVSARAEDRAFVISNATAKTITGFSVTPNAADASALNLVPAGGLEPQGLLDTTVPSATDACLFDLRIAYDDGAEDIRPDVDFCNLDGYIVE
jgi:hypothetical protein